MFHAVSRNDPPCILTQLKIENYPHIHYALFGREEDKEEGEGDSSDEYIDPDPPVECCSISFIPDDEKQLDVMFDAFSE